MTVALNNLVPIFIAFSLGVNRRYYLKKVNMTIINKLSNTCLYLLLIFMGMTVGLLPNIISKILNLGSIALAIAMTTSICIAITLGVIEKRRRKKRIKNIKKGQDFDIIGYIKDPLTLMVLVIFGFCLSYNHLIPNIGDDLIVSALLYLMIFFIGIKLSFSSLNLKTIFLNRKNVMLASATILSSYFGAFVISFFLNISMKDCLAVSSGFGWYSLSGILFAKMNNPMLASIAFLCDFFREVIALLLIPTLSRLGSSNMAIGVAGATAMDVTLPIIEKHCGIEYVPIAFVSGGIITVLVPFLIPLFYSLS